MANGSDSDRWFGHVNRVKEGHAVKREYLERVCSICRGTWTRKCPMGCYSERSSDVRPKYVLFMSLSLVGVDLPWSQYPNSSIMLLMTNLLKKPIVIIATNVRGLSLINHTICLSTSFIVYPRHLYKTIYFFIYFLYK